MPACATVRACVATNAQGGGIRSQAVAKQANRRECPLPGLRGLRLRRDPVRQG